MKGTYDTIFLRDILRDIVSRKTVMKLNFGVTGHLRGHCVPQEIDSISDNLLDKVADKAKKKK